MQTSTAKFNRKPLAVLEMKHADGHIDLHILRSFLCNWYMYVIRNSQLLFGCPCASTEHHAMKVYWEVKV